MTQDFETYATLRTTTEKFQELIKQSSLEGDVSHSDLYLNILENEVQVLQSAPGEVVLTYCSFHGSFFDELSLKTDIEEHSATTKGGSDLTYETGAEAIINVSDALRYLSYASESGKIELHFQGQDDGKRLAQRLKFEGALDAWVRLDGSKDILDDVPHWLPFRFSENEVYTNIEGDEAPTQITTGSQKLRKIIEIVQGDDKAEFYPVTVNDGDFSINIGEVTDSGVQGTINTKDISGPDIENYYFDGFDEIFSTIGGQVQLQTAPKNNPMAVVQEGADGRVVRHVNGPVSK